MDASAVNKSNKTIAYVAGGVIAGLIIAGIFTYLLMPKMMILTYSSKLGFNETVTAIEKAIIAQGWSSPGTSDMNASMAKGGVEFGPKVRIVKLCKPEYAARVLEKDRNLSCLMPCSIAVWEGDDGKVYISKMNTGLMGKLFGGVVAEVMGGNVAEDEHAILQGVIEKAV